MLTELGAHFAAQFAASSIFTMLWFYLFPIFTVVVVVINVPVFGRIFWRICVVRCHLCHCGLTFLRS